MTSSLEKPRDKICVVVANEIHTGAVELCQFDEFLALDKVGSNRGEFFLADHLVTLWQSNRTGGSTTANQLPQWLGRSFNSSTFRTFPRFILETYQRDSLG